MGPKKHLLPAPRPRPAANTTYHEFEYRARGRVRFALQNLINLNFDGFVVYLKYIEEIDHCEVWLKVPQEHVAEVRRILGITD